MAPVHYALKLFLIERSVDVGFGAFLPNVNGRGGADDAPVKDLEKLGAREKRLTHFSARIVLDDVWDARVCVQRQVAWQVASCGYDNPFAVGAVIERLKSASDLEAVGLDRRRNRMRRHNASSSWAD